MNTELEAATASAATNASDIANLGALASRDTVNSPQIENNSVTLAKLDDIDADRIIGRITSGNGNPQELTAENVRTIINVEDGATADQTAAEVPFTPDGSIVATNVQAAIVEVRDEAVGLPIAISDVTNLQTELDGKSDTSHTHTLTDITDSGALAALDTVGTSEIDNNNVTFAKIQDISQDRLIGRTSSGSGDPEELTDATVRTFLNVDGALAALDTVDTAQIDSGAVTADKMATDAVGETIIVDGAVTRAKLDSRSINAQTGTSYTLAATDAQGVVTTNNASANDLDIPANIFSLGDQIDVIQRGAGTTTIDAASGVLLNGVDGDTVDMGGQHSAATILCVGTNTFQVFGNIA